MSDFDFDDDLSHLLNSPVRETPILPPASYKPREFTEKCPKCRGSGNFVSYSGRVVGPCFACKGAGNHTFKTSAEDRAIARTKAGERKARQTAEMLAEFEKAHPGMLKFLGDARRPGFDFPEKMLEALKRWGSLTEGQLAACERMMARDAERKAERAKRDAEAPTVDMTKIVEAFARARGEAAAAKEGVKWLKLRLDSFVFSDAPARGEWPAAVFIKEGEKKLGRIVNGKFMRSFACDDATAARVIAAAADPAAAAVAYGLRTGSCACCGRELTNRESIDRGIGPICAERFFGG